MHEIDYYEIEFKNYHGQIMGRIRFVNKENKKEESNLYSISELNQILTNWKTGKLLGSFAIGTKLSKNHNFQIFQGA